MTSRVEPSHADPGIIVTHEDFPERLAVVCAIAVALAGAAFVLWGIS